VKAVSGKTLCRALERQGWKRVRTRGSHRRYEKPGNQPITAPVHGNKTLPTGLQRAVMNRRACPKPTCRQAGRIPGPGRGLRLRRPGGAGKIG
jgi:predicted RNA binding protein YcfA (HicA-like mRNA interferase family)